MSSTLLVYIRNLDFNVLLLHGNFLTDHSLDVLPCTNDMIYSLHYMKRGHNSRPAAASPHDGSCPVDAGVLAGDWHYRVYNQTESTITVISRQSLRFLQSGIPRFHPQYITVLWKQTKSKNRQHNH